MSGSLRMIMVYFNLEPSRRWRGFLAGIATSRVCDHYMLGRDSQRWHKNVTRRMQVGAGATSELTHVETATLTLARRFDLFFAKQSQQE